MSSSKRSMRCIRLRNIAVCFSTSENSRSEEHTSELQSQSNLVCRLLLEKKISFFFFEPSLATGRKNDNRSRNFAERTATVAAQSVAKTAVPTLTVGRAEPAAAEIALAGA